MPVNHSKSGLPLPFHKVNAGKQTAYIYHTVTGDITITPIEDGKLRVTDETAEGSAHSFILDGDGVTVELLQDLHRMDNSEVQQNYRQARKPMSDKEKEDIDRWRRDPDHPDRLREYQFPENYQRWNLSIDSQSDEEEGTNALDRDPVMAAAWYRTHETQDTQRDLVRDFVGTLSDRQQELYCLVYIQGFSINEAAEAMGVTHQRATTLNKQLMANLMKHFQK
ncbi:MAG: sigma-70 family RNA polymerase sigma factor [Clostridia bacterium]|nr:sigma-70 family RNA polymerase sigma factor [Clostridia bacterium]